MVSGRSSSSEESSHSSSLPPGSSNLIPNGIGGPLQLTLLTSAPTITPSNNVFTSSLINNTSNNGTVITNNLISNNEVLLSSCNNLPIINNTSICGGGGGNGSGGLLPENNNQNQILVTLQEKRLISEFCHLQEKSKQLFNQLRDLPPHFSTLGAAYNPHHDQNGGGVRSHHQASSSGSGNTLSCQQAYFSRAFDIFTKLWKFQQMHRQTLDKKYGLKRWQIGDIASKIGQLYYHYYLRTSELAYLHEALSFYGAIRARGYYANRSLSRGSGRNEGGLLMQGASHQHQGQHHHQGESGLIVKKLRYYARFIVVSLLLRKNNLKDLLRELSLHVENYVATVDDEPEEQLEWNLVLSEIRGFIDADSPIVVYDNSTEKLVDPLDQVLILSHRLPREVTPKNYRPVDDLLSHPKDNYKVHEILIIGNKGEQLKFSELTVDMFRMTQTFERSHPVDERDTSSSRNLLSLGTNCPLAGGSGEQLTSTGEVNKNPHKYLLYRAPIEQILVTLNAAWSDLPWNGVLLLYLSADPSADNKGLATTNKTFNKSKTFEINRQTTGAEDGKEINCLYPSDLLPLTRKPLVVIVDSENSHLFLELRKEAEGFGQPLVVLMSPEILTHSSAGGSSGHPHVTSSRGSLFTLFLHCPLAGLCTLSGIKSLTLSTWNQLEHLLNIFFSEAFEKVKCDFGLEGGMGGNWEVYMKLLGDDFLRLIILRFLFAQLLFQMHKDFQHTKLQPKCYPEVSILGKESNGLETTRLEELIYEMTDLIQSKHLFNQI